ncbi:major type 1 subunit fimbrin (pilin) [Variovorax boronicumulans]|uniref:fimbrial protein n=1 Tax=Variovorax TaxID=34072 RepID=UPI0027834266|nr:MULTISPECIES: fimbrial protein [Variovorax]MDQ0037060.1 major type 1 subunit fimbrin (pilin) [Variovorax boronicumulans]MDQ0611086.1 type 1 fimbria pilin [Variovorax sp. W1I1]
MKKFVLIKFASLAVAGVLSQSAFAIDGTINFTGEITTQACSVSPNSQNLIVPLGKVSTNAFGGSPATIGAKSTPAQFTIDLLGCDTTTIKNASVSFSGNADLDNNTKLRLANAGQVGAASALGVAIEIGDSAGTKIDLNTGNSGDYILGQGDNSLKFQAAYIATRAVVAAGPANAVAQFTIAYK